MTMKSIVHWIFIEQKSKGLVLKLFSVCQSTVPILLRGIHSIRPLFVTFVRNSQGSQLIELEAILKKEMIFN